MSATAANECYRRDADILLVFDCESGRLGGTEGSRAPTRLVRPCCQAVIATRTRTPRQP